MKEKVKSGSVTISGADDILSRTLGPEHGGRVRGVGGFVTPTSYFGLPRRKRPRMEDMMEEMLKKAVEQERAFWIEQLNSIKTLLPAGTLPAGLPNAPPAAKVIPPVSGQGSCSLTASDEPAKVHVTPADMTKEKPVVDATPANVAEEKDPASVKQRAKNPKIVVKKKKASKRKLDLEADGEEVPEPKEKSEDVDDVGDSKPHVVQEPACQEAALGLTSQNPMVSFKDLLNIS